MKLFVNTYKSEEQRSFGAQIFDVLLNSQNLMVRSGEVEMVIPLEGAKFLLLDERDTDKPQKTDMFLQCEWSSGNRIIFSLPG